MQGIWRIRELPRRRSVRRMTALLMFGSVVASILAGCTPPALTNPAPTVASISSLHFLLDNNSHSQDSRKGLRYSVVATDIHDGHTVWKHALETPGTEARDLASAPPVLANGLIYVGYNFTLPSNYSYSALAALDAKTGHLRWRHDVDSKQITQIQGQPVVSGSSVYLSVVIFHIEGGQESTSGLVQVLDSQTGALRWQTALSNVPTMVTVVDGRALVMTGQEVSGYGHLLALSAQNGSLLWDYTTNGLINRGGDVVNGWSSAPVVSGQLAYPQTVERVTDAGAEIAQLAINTSDGSLAWKYELQGKPATPVLDESGDILCIGAFLPGKGVSNVTGLDATTGRLRWTTSLRGIASGCVAAGSVFYLSYGSSSDPPSSFIALNSRNGHELWSAAMGTPIDADGTLVPSVSSGLVATYADAGLSPTNSVMTAIVVVRSSDGALVWKHIFSGRPEKIMDIEGGQIYTPEYSGLSPLISAYSLTTGAKLWTYNLGKG